MTARLISVCSHCCAISFTSPSTSAEICCSENCWLPSRTAASPRGPATISYGTRLMRSLTTCELNCRPTSRLAPKTVFPGLMRSCPLAGWPTITLPFSLMATMEGMVL